MELGRLHVAGRAGAARRDDADAIVHGCLAADHLSLLGVAGPLVRRSNRRCSAVVCGWCTVEVPLETS